MNINDCFECGALMELHREDRPYRSLPGVTLKNLKVWRCPSCGYFEVAIPNPEELNRLLASILTRQPRRLAGTEIRFLRKYLGFSGRDLAAEMGVTPETVSRWENGEKPIGSVADRLLRLMAMTREPVSDYSLADVARKEAAKVSRLAEHRGDAWNITELAA